MLRWRLVPAPRRSETAVLRRRAALRARRPCKVRRLPAAVAARRRCSWDPRRGGRRLRIPRLSGMPSPSKDRRRGSCSVTRSWPVTLSLTQTRSCGLSLPPGTGCRCSLPVIRFIPPNPLYHRPGQRIRRQGRSIPPKSKSLRQAAGSSPCHGTGTRTLSTSGTSGTGSNSQTSAWTRLPARAAECRKPHCRDRITVPARTRTPPR
jgi:hypothetical protein